MSFRLNTWWRGAVAAALWPALHSLAEDGATNAATSPEPSRDAESLVEQASHEAESGDLEQADRDVSAALDLAPKNLRALELRGSIYMTEKLWDRAERDYTTLNQVSPDPAYRYKLAQIKFLQKDFSNARPLFAALQDDGRLGDLARYKVFICDLLGGHEAIAERDLGTLDRTGRQPSSFYGQAAWALYQHQGAVANRLFAQASGLFSSTICGLYLEPLIDAKPFHLSLASFTTKDGRAFDHARVSLESDGLRTSTSQGWITIPLDQLPDDLSPFPEDLREQIVRRREASTSAPDEAPRLSFTTKSGKTYRQVRWTLGDAGLDVATPDGWTCVPFDDLPPDRSVFPTGLQSEIAEKIREGAGFDASINGLSFVTRQGKRFDHVRVSLGEDSIKALTRDGWTALPFADLPDDLSAFPSGWQAQIRASLRSRPDDDPRETVVSFTTQGGTAYRSVRASIDDDGVTVLTPDGWRSLPFADLPSDLSAFPATWRPKIQAGLKPHPDNLGAIRVVSFTTRRGDSYDQIRARMDDDGVHVLGPDGWIVVGYDQLPGDLAAFPEAWRAVIAARQQKEEANSKP